MAASLDGQIIVADYCLNGNSALDSTTSASESQIQDAQLEDGSHPILATYSEKFQELTRWDTWLECVFGCGTGGAIYLTLATLVSLCFDSTVVVILLIWPILVIFGFLLGLILGTLASIVVLPINVSLGRPLKSFWVSFIVGGLAGFLPFLYLLLFSRNPQDVDWTYIGALGVFPQMVLGHLCAYWMTEKAVNDHNQRFGVVKYEDSQVGIRSSRFGIIHIMILTIWLALGFSLLSCCTLEFQLLLAGLYSKLQVASALMAIVVIRFVARVRDYRRRNLSTPDH